MTAVSSTTLSTDVCIAGGTLSLSALSLRDTLILDSSPVQKAKALYAGAAPTFEQAKLPLLTSCRFDPHWENTAHILATELPFLIFDICRLIATYLPRCIPSSSIPSLYAQMEEDLKAKAIALPPPLLIPKVDVVVALPPVPLCVFFGGSYPTTSIPFKLFYNTAPHYQFLVYRQEGGPGQALFESNPAPEPPKRAATHLMPSWRNAFTLLFVPLVGNVVDADKMTLLHFSTFSLPVKDGDGTRNRSALLQELHQTVPRFRTQLEARWKPLAAPSRALKRKAENIVD